MHGANLKRPSCIIMLVLFAIAIAVLVWAISGEPLRKPNPATITKATTTYDTDIPPSEPPGGR